MADRAGVGGLCVRWRVAVVCAMTVGVLGAPSVCEAAPAAQAVQAAASAASQDPLPDGPGKDVFEMTCGVCHEVDTAIGTRRTSADWQLVIDAMINRGAIASQDEFKAILAYLTKHFVVVNVNKADAEEIAKVLEVPVPVAGAIVKQRTEQGPFASLEELKKVPGLDAKGLEDRKVRVAFK